MKKTIRCTTHFHACDCREYEFEMMKKENEELKKQVELAKNQEYHALTNPWRIKYGEVKSENEELKLDVKKINEDYWFMINLIEKYSSNKDEALKDILERLKFRKPLLEKWFKGEKK